MRLLVLLCFSFLQLSVAVSPTVTAVRSFCPPASPISPIGGAIAPPSTPGSVVFNEILDNPGAKTLWNCTVQTNSPWLELFNPYNQAYDLHASFAAIDHGQGTTSYYLAIGSIIAAHSFLVIFPSLSNQFIFQGQSALFRLLLQGVPVDQVMVPALGSDQSYARMPDGAAGWQITDTPTIGVSNSTAVATAVATRSSSNPPAHTSKSQTATRTPRQASTHKKASSTPAEKLPATRTSAASAGEQPTWHELHLPQSTPILPPSASTALPTTRQVPPENDPAWPFLLAIIGLPVASGGILYWQKKRMKAT